MVWVVDQSQQSTDTELVEYVVLVHLNQVHVTNQIYSANSSPVVSN